MITPVPFPGPAAAPVQTDRAYDAASAILFEQLVTGLTQSLAETDRSPWPVPERLKKDSNADLPCRFTLPGDPGPHPLGTWQEYMAWTPPRVWPGETDPEVKRHASPAPSDLPFALAPEALGEPTRRLDVWIDPDTIPTKASRGIAFDLELHPSLGPLHPGESPGPHQRVLDGTPSPWFSKETLNLPEKCSVTPVTLIARPLAMARGNEALLSGLDPSNTAASSFMLSAPDSWSVPLHQHGEPRLRTARPSRPSEGIAPGRVQSDSASLKAVGRTFEPFGFLATGKESKSREALPAENSYPVPSAVPIPRSTPAPASPPSFQNVQAGDELFIAPPQSPGDASVRFVLEDWNHDLPVRTIRIALEPQELGTLRITLSHRAGQVHARIVVEHAEALHVVQAQTLALESALADRGLLFGSVSVTVASAATAAGLRAEAAARPGHRDPSEAKSTKKEDDVEAPREEVTSR